jgi:hypothetical protein
MGALTVTVAIGVVVLPSGVRLSLVALNLAMGTVGIVIG